MEDFNPRPPSPLESNRHHQHGRREIKTRSRRRSPQRFKVPPGHVAFRLLCHQSAIGGVIGNNGAVVSQLRRATDTKIHCENPAPGSDYSIILVIGSRSRDRTITLTAGAGKESGREQDFRGDVSGAQEAMFRVLERIWMLEAQGDHGGGAVSRMVWCRLLAHGSQIRAVMGKGGTNVVLMRKQSGADIRILPEFVGGRDEVIQISGTVLAVKKALLAVSLCLQDHPPLENGPTFLNGLTESSSYGAPHISDSQAEFFPNHALFLPQTSFNNNASEDSSMMDASGVSTNGTKGTRQEVVFRLLCSNDAAGSVIGRKGAIVRALENETSASIRFAAPTTGSIERVVTISALENLESGFSPAQNAVVLVFARSVEGDIEKGFILGFSQGASVAAKLLVSSDLVGCLSENEGKVISEIREVSGADIQILGGDFENQVVQITGEYKSVQNALFQVTSSLRNHLLPHDVLNDVRPRSSFGKVPEPMSSGPYHSLGLFTDANDEAALTGQMNRLRLSHTLGSFPTRLQLPQIVEAGHSKAVTDGREVLTKFGGDLEVVREGECFVTGHHQPSGFICDRTTFRRSSLLQITNHKLDGKNFLQWSQSVKLVLRGRGKLGNITGKVKHPDTMDPTYANWELNNSLVMAWLINSMEPHISRTYLFLRTAKAIWEAVKENYSDLENAFQVFEIKNRLKALQQGTSDIIEYYNSLQMLWQELDMHYEADWGALEENKKFQKHLEKKRLYEFLVGLNKDLDEVRGRILGRRPLPSIGEAFAEVRREASRRRVMLGEKKDQPALPISDRPVENTAFIARNFANKSADQKPSQRPRCSHCNKLGHTRERCWDIHGKRGDMKPRRNSQGKALQAITEEKSEGTSSTASTGVFLNKEQLEQLLSLLNQQSVTTSKPATGTGFGEDDWHC